MGIQDSLTLHVEMPVKDHYIIEAGDVVRTGGSSQRYWKQRLR